MQRARGRAAVRFASSDRGVRLAGLHQSGAAKALLPRTHGPVPEAVFLNTAGGVTGGDVFDYRLDLDAGARCVATTQTAERVYASSGGAGRIDVRLTAGAGAVLDWLPQETILFDQAALDRTTEIDLGPDAQCLSVETLILGRAAMGETVRRLALRDRRTIRRNGRPIVAEPVALDDRILARGDAAGLAGARALATLVFVAPGAEDALGPVREDLAQATGIAAAASSWDGRLILRAMAPGGAPLRRALVRLIARLGQAGLPRVWQA
ncbi:urease accessory protein UreD [Mesobaculum littorinae]|uniref:Urease accessory protein UreD n=1 Tax=Mesobaculum littorinae TaxID=2486419 RepID=A0A438AND5_9RHOB|nr:urease accessory protein UreD [Mesobaculum littorinae]RVW00037.1 urease accessory protein UreD [Mesobaculum littorinae]